MSSGRLLLHPGTEAVDVDAVVTCLRELEFIGDAYVHAAAPDSRRWLAGDRLLRLLTFLGCSPTLSFEPPDDDTDDFCHIQLDGPHPRPVFRHGRNTRFAQCPACRFRPDDSGSLIDSAARNADAPWHCPQCGATTPLGELNWRRDAGAGRLFVVIHSVFPNEAVPNPELMQALRHASGQEWRHCYCQ